MEEELEQLLREVWEYGYANVSFTEFEESVFDEYARKIIQLINKE